ncbi:hypothetical protein, partial [Ekhidna sp.]
MDSEIQRLASRNQHISLKGESKSGKSWLRQKNFPDSVVVQCRIEFTKVEIFSAIFSELDINVTLSENATVGGTLSFSGKGEIGWQILAKAEAEAGIEGNYSKEYQKKPIGKDIGDLRYICEVIKASKRRIVIEDFHYLPSDTQRSLSHDLKAMWDYGVYLVIIGVWAHRNYLTYLNPDLAGRIREVSVYWNEKELKDIIYKGCSALNIDMSQEIVSQIASDAFGNAGLVQSLTLSTLDESQIYDKAEMARTCNKTKHYENAALLYAEQLEAVFLEFARRVASGLRRRKASTGIYAYSIWAIFDSSNDELIKGVSVDTIFERANSRQPRVQKSNLRLILPRIDELQIDDRGKGLVVTFSARSDSVVVVDRSV